ncbi:MAG: MMPL family transporter, partial [Chitinispirillaceae bacterium]|nr:MMPL family transporter [Chitinispirillaceae bacterium]
IVKAAIEEIPSTKEEKKELQESLSKNEMVLNFVISKDFKYSAIMIELETSASTKEVLRKTIEIVNSFKDPEKIHIAGQPAFENIITQEIGRDIAILIPVAVVIILLIFYGFYRSVKAIILPLGVVVLSTLFGLGILPLMQWKFTILTAILPLMVIGFTNNYGIYLVSKYQEYTNNSNFTPSQIAIKIFNEFSMPILFSALTTVVGVLGLLTHIMIPAKHIGIAAALAICFSLIATLGGIIGIFSLLKIPTVNKKISSTSSGVLDIILTKTGTIITNHPMKVIIGALIVLLLSVYSAFHLKVDANQENLFEKSHPIRTSTDIINKHFGGSHSMLIMFEGDIKDPSLLKEMQNIKQELLKLPGVSQVNSIADVIITISKAVNDKDSPEYNAIPSSRDAVAQYLELYAMSGGDPSDFEKLVDFNYTKALMILRINNGATDTISKIENYIKNIAKNNP